MACLSRQMLSAIAYCHSQFVAHRDVKPSNWLICGKGIFPVLKLSDFGLAATFSDQPMDKTCGSFQYMAPEVFQRSYSELCDVWSSGLVICDLVCGKPLFGHVPESQLEDAVCKGEIKLDHMEWNHHSSWLLPWLQKMLLRESEGRISARAALAHPEVHDAKWQGRCICAVS